MKAIKYIGVSLMLVVAALTVSSNTLAASLAVVAAALTVVSWKEPKK